MNAVPQNLSEDRRSVTLRVTENPEVFIRMSTGQILSLLRRLAAVRQRMEPAVPTRFAPSQEYRGTLDPAWAVETRSDAEGTILHVREPGLDWLHFVLTPDEARKLGETLLEGKTSRSP